VSDHQNDTSHLSNGSFSVTWGERSIHTEQPARPTLLALGGGTL
jgi:hypothetical protein